MRSYDPDIFRYAFRDHPEYIEGISPEDWVSDENNLMYHHEGSVGLLTYNYFGCYTGHWFFNHRGRKALDLARTMLDDVFTNHNGKIIRGMTSITIPAARWAARQIGFTSHGFMDFPKTGKCEVFTLTKEDFYKEDK